MAHATDGHDLLLHGFEQSRLSLGRGAVDLVSQDDVGEDRAGLELEDAPLGPVQQHGGAQDVSRHQVRGELHAAVLQVQRVGDGAHQQRLAQARQTFQQHVAAS